MGNDIYIYYTRFSIKLKPETFNFLLKQLPRYLQTKIMRYRKWEDAHRSLLGKALLIYGLDYIGHDSYSLNDLKFTQFERPYFDNSIDFNISHAGEYIICAISTTNKIGIDVEQVQNISLNDFKENFSQKEWKNILKADNIIQSFFIYWTRKEAFLKAIGMGLNVPLKNVDTTDNEITWDNKKWFLHEIKLDNDYVSYISCDAVLPEMVIKEINFN
ncbi:MAG: 4'-phosphopantetheinyl transferase family protein [Chitinophagaceae bacterium]